MLDREMSEPLADREGPRDLVRGGVGEGGVVEPDVDLTPGQIVDELVDVGDAGESERDLA